MVVAQAPVYPEDEAEKQKGIKEGMRQQREGKARARYSRGSVIDLAEACARYAAAHSPDHIIVVDDATTLARNRYGIERSDYGQGGCGCIFDRKCWEKVKELPVPSSNPERHGNRIFKWRLLEPWASKPPKLMSPEAAKEWLENMALDKNPEE